MSGLQDPSACLRCRYMSRSAGSVAVASNTAFASGASADLTGERLATDRLKPGTYRLEIHNWAGPAGNHVPVKGTFYNTAGTPGS